jgi:ABC-2 type transport system ATP-binding protein
MIEKNQIDSDLSQVKPLVVRQLTKTYPGCSAPAIQDVELSVEKGEIFGLLGPNGAGKTTAISIMSSLMRPDHGQIFICGIDMLKKPDPAKRLLGFVPQDIALYDKLTIRENLNYFGRLYGLRGRDLKERVQAGLEMVKLQDKADQRFNTYSGGIKRRANLAAGILYRPRVLFLDEPMVGIDAQSRNLILEKLSFLKQEGISMIYTTHYMEEAEYLCSRIAVMDEGRIIAQGTPQELIQNHPGCGNLEEVFLKLTGKQLRD